MKQIKMSPIERTKQEKEEIDNWVLFIFSGFIAVVILLGFLVDFLIVNIF
jgi:hypothetical protein